MKVQDMPAWDDETRAAAENRPMVEFWPDEWVERISGHRGDKNPLGCHGALKAGPLCPFRWH
jgi:hypothetical protein